MSDTDSLREELSPGQKKYVIRCYEFMKTEKARGIFQGRKTRDLVAECLKSTRRIVEQTLWSESEKTSQRGRPPYHPELQPIELIWATVKGRIAQQPPTSGSDAVQKVLDGLAAITRKEFLAVYRHAQSFENNYVEQARESSEQQLMAAEDYQ